MANWIDDLADDLRRIAAGAHHDPHAVLGAHERGKLMTLIAYLPAAQSVRVDDRLGLTRVRGTDFFRWQGPRGSLKIVLAGGLEEEREVRILWTIERTAGPGEVSLPEPSDAPEAEEA